MKDKNGNEMNVGDPVVFTYYDGEVIEGNVSSFLDSLDMVYVQDHESKLYHLINSGLIEKI